MIHLGSHSGIAPHNQVLPPSGVERRAIIIAGLASGFLQACGGGDSDTIPRSTPVSPVTPINYPNTHFPLGNGLVAIRKTGPLVVGKADCQIEVVNGVTLYTYTTSIKELIGFLGTAPVSFKSWGRSYPTEFRFSGSQFTPQIALSNPAITPENTSYSPFDNLYRGLVRLGSNNTDILVAVTEDAFGKVTKDSISVNLEILVEGTWYNIGAFETKFV